MPNQINSYIEIAFFAAAIYLFLRFLRSTRGAGIVRGLILICIVLGLSLIALLNTTQLPHLEYVFKAIVEIVILAMVILFQPELRRGISRLGENPLLSRFAQSNKTKMLGELSQVAAQFSKSRTGALIAIERDSSLDPYIEEGTKLDAKLTPALLESIFYPGGALHDGAIILRGERIAAAGCVLPLSENRELPSRLGTRHRAALGLTENTDAVTIVVSEETGEISLCHHGQIERNIPDSELENVLKKVLFRSSEKTPVLSGT